MEYWTTSPRFMSCSVTLVPTPTLSVRDGVGVDDDGAAQPLLERVDARLEHGLLVLGVVVLGVLRDVAEVARGADALGDLVALDGREVLDLLLEALEALGREDDLAVDH